MSSLSGSGISFNGLASGLDTQAIIQALLAVERRPVTALQQKKKDYETRKSLFGDFGSKLAALKDEAAKLKTTSSFVERKATTDKDTWLTASASSAAALGSYDIQVLALAQAEISRSLGKADTTTTTYGNGTLHVTIDGATHDVQINGGQNDTLQGIADAINAADLGVQASILNTGAGATPYQLVLTGQTTGAAGAFSITATGDAGITGLADEINANQTTTAQDASVSINGTTIYRASNTISDAIAGVTLNLKGVSAVETTKVTIALDAEATGARLKKFVDAYNAVVDFVAQQSELGEGGKPRNPLFGDTTLRNVRSSLRSLVGGTVDTGNQSYSLFSQVGISSDTDGRLTFDQSKFEQALNDDTDAVKALFTDEAQGIAVRLYERTDQYTDTVEGIVKVRQDGFQALIKQTDDAVARGERRLTALEQQLVTKFSNLETLLSKLQSQGSALGSFNNSAR